jgi:hypothetical protein
VTGAAGADDMRASATWIEDGEKYAMIGLNIKLAGQIPTGNMTEHFSVLADTAFVVPDHWKEWLGTIRVEQVEACNLFLLTKLVSQRPGVMDAEDLTLRGRVNRFYVGFLLASTGVPADPPVMFVGARHDGEVGVRQQQNFDSPVPGLILRYPSVTADQLRLAARLGEQLEALPEARVPGGHWRISNLVYLYRGQNNRGPSGEDPPELPMHRWADFAGHRQQPKAIQE